MSRPHRRRQTKWQPIPPPNGRFTARFRAVRAQGGGSCPVGDSFRAATGPSLGRHPCMPDPENSFTMLATKPLASPNSMRVFGM